MFVHGIENTYVNMKIFYSFIFVELLTNKGIKIIFSLLGFYLIYIITCCK